MMTKNLTILGSTGSIGRQTLEVVEQLPVRIAALTAGQNVERMAEQCRRFRPQLAVMGTEEAAQRLRRWQGRKLKFAPAWTASSPRQSTRWRTPL